MKICLIQPPYSLASEKGADCFRKEMDMLRSVGEPGSEVPAADVIVLPEYSGVLFAERDRDEMLRAHEETFPVLLETAREAALRCGAVNLILLHNHPSGDCEPSAADLELTRRFKSAGAILGITLLDHIIIGGSSYVSFSERGLLDEV